MPEELAAASKDWSSGMLDVLLFMEVCNHAMAVKRSSEDAAWLCLHSHTYTWESKGVASTDPTPSQCVKEQIDN